VAWQRVDLVVAGARAEALADALAEAGAISTELTDADAGTAAEAAIFGEPGSVAAPWPRSRVTALFAEGHDVARAVEAALAACGSPAIDAASVDRLEDADWVARTQREFEPIRAGERLWIVPTWHAAPDPGAVNVALDPGAAFGTGSHPTTRLCLAWLEANVRPGDTILDYGCGSGILAIAAMKLGAARARAVDIDPLALEAARYNALRNDVRVEVIDGARGAEGFEGGARITIANILANPLRMLAPILASHTRPGGALALSGILASQATDVAEAYARWARLAVAAEEGDWVLLAGERHAGRC
jgi:ribosomal protein L11 methyltransferase